MVSDTAGRGHGYPKYAGPIYNFPFAPSYAAMTYAPLRPAVPFVLALLLGGVAAHALAQAPAPAAAPAASSTASLLPKANCGERPEHPGRLASDAMKRNWRTAANAYLE